MWLVSLCAIVLSFAGINVGDGSGNLFILPTAPGPNNNFVADLAWAIGSLQKIQWTTTLDSYYIDLYQQVMGESFAQQLPTLYSVTTGGSGQQSFNWEVQTYTSNITFSSKLVKLKLVDGLYIIDFPGSQYDRKFNFKSSDITATTSPTTTSPTTTSPATTPPAKSSTETLKVGLGVGLGIGIPLVLIAGVWIGLMSLRQRRSSSRGTSSEVPLTQSPNHKYPPYPYPPPNGPTDYANEIHEAPGRSPELHEAPGQRDLIELS
ncbi:MAG: hypothetical protein Q9161_005542 [Pseudevernia consocians]